ncbi:MAG: 16S rRNA (cytosine(1402)-N(4))-methyltransferase RsmH [Proteobacteria bacterium]|nr:16S rRNA (cytosine(1402)-N(4))-methyltransferase RsmH [Pseudomonadota bacterium]
MEHWPALADAVVEFLEPKSGGIYFDGTVGEGGHAEAILKRSGPDGRLIGTDVDPQAIDSARRRLEVFQNRVTLAQANYREIREVLASAGVKEVNGILLDLGVSSRQLDDPERGFSFMRSGPLDMRMDQEGGETASDLVNRAPLPVLEKIIGTLGEEPRARRIAGAIGEARRKKRIETTGELAAIVARGGATRRPGRSRHPATLTFQALRLAVNRELENLETFLPLSIQFLSPRGRMVLISYHSLEDRLVKNFFKSLSPGQAKILTRTPLRPDAEEVSQSRYRTRSARLRALEKADEEA